MHAKGLPNEAAVNNLKRRLGKLESQKPDSSFPCLRPTNSIRHSGSEAVTIFKSDFRICGCQLPNGSASPPVDASISSIYYCSHGSLNRLQLRLNLNGNVQVALGQFWLLLFQIEIGQPAMQVRNIGPHAEGDSEHLF